MPDLFLQFSDAQDRLISPGAPLSEATALDVLKSAEINAAQLIPWGSNYSFAVGLEDAGGVNFLAIYKPRDGEAPLYDFTDGSLYRREVAAYWLSRDLGWDIVPATVVRDGPHGIGSLQLYVQPEADPDRNPRAFWSQTRIEMERIVLFDLIANNADRKLSHCLIDVHGKIWGIDHGLTFNAVPKLRTVLWQFVGCNISKPLLADLRRYRENAAAFSDMRQLLSRREVEALSLRIDRLIDEKRYPPLNPYRNVPYGWW